MHFSMILFMQKMSVNVNVIDIIQCEMSTKIISTLDFMKIKKIKLKTKP